MLEEARYGWCQEVLFVQTSIFYLYIAHPSGVKLWLAKATGN
jgi:hypothetical protein